MKKKYTSRLFVIFAVTIFAAACLLVILAVRRNVLDKSNFFEYAIDLENENWSYAPKGLDYGMTAEEVIKAEHLKNYTWEVDGEILHVEKTVNNIFSEIKELEFVKRYFFDGEGGLASVRYEITVESEYEERIRQLLYDQALAYMPETNRKSELQGLLDFENIILLGPWNKVVVWEDTKYEEDTSEVLTLANSDVVLRVGRPDVTVDDTEEEGYQRDVVVNLTVSRYEERLTQAQVTELREKYPVCGVEYAPLICVQTFGMEQWFWQAETFVYGEVVGNELSSESSQYEMSVIRDTEGMLPAGKIVSTDYRPKMMDYELYPTDGMRLVAMAVTASYNEAKEWYFDMDMPYYVTEDGYVISTFDENKELGYLGYRVMESALSGLKLEDLLRKLKK